MNTERTADLEKAIEKVVRAELSDAAIDAVYASPDVDEDGESIIRVTIVFKSAAAFDAKKAKGLIRRLFPVLKESTVTRETMFPIVSFRSKADHVRLSAAA